MNDYVKILFGLMGGLALFLYGMNSMSDALQKTAGEKMKKILSFLTKNAVMGALAGALVTAVLQSSSATTVMVIGFVSAGLMSLPQAISVIFGANIGTTMTAQLIAFKISDYIYPIIFIGFMMNFVCKKEKIKNIGMVVFSFGVLFEGIEIMGEVMKPLASSPIFIELMSKVVNVPILGVLVGLVMTLIVQSSSATIAVLQNFASQASIDGVTSIIGLSGAIPILLGDNIGTTITAILASIGQSTNAKRTAVAHSIFNITGSILFLFFIPVLVKFVQFISPKGPEVEVISRQIANAHTTFNVVCTLIWLPLIPLMVKIVTFLVKGKDNNEIKEYEPQFIDQNLISQPVVAICLVSKEINRLFDHCKNLIFSLKEYIVNRDDENNKEIFDQSYENVKKLQDSIVSYITKLLSSGNLTEQQAEQVAGLLYVSNSVDRIADRSKEIDDICNKFALNNKDLSLEARSGLKDSLDKVEVIYDDSVQSLKDGNIDLANKVYTDKKALRKNQKQLSKAHIKRVENNTCSADMTTDFSKLLVCIDRIADNCVFIAEETLEDICLAKLDNIDIEQTEVTANA